MANDLRGTMEEYGFKNYILGMSEVIIIHSYEKGLVL